MKVVNQKRDRKTPPEIEVTKQIRHFTEALTKDPDPDNKIAAARWLKILDAALEKGQLPEAA